MSSWFALSTLGVMTQQKVLCLGFGYTAAAFARRLQAQDRNVAGTTRDAAKFDAMAREGVEPRLWGESGLDAEILDDVTAILISTAPRATGCPAFSEMNEAIAARAETLEWIGYLSTNGVYGDHQGAWVDENSDLFPTSDRARFRIRAEADWAGLSVAFGLPLIIFRLPGIYGPGRSAIDSVRNGKARRIQKEGQVFSRAHVDDIAAALVASMEQPRLHDLYNIADDEPAPPQDVIAYACDLLGVAPPPLVPIDEADLSDMGKSFYADNKRVSNARLKKALDFTFQYPTYREGLSAILKSENEAP
ncbi:MAG: SDR family oxidoreductase [Pseudomonadota bacterium]